MNDSKKMAIIIAVVFFLAGTMLNVDYAMWNEKTHNEYHEYMQNILEGNISVTIPVTKEQFEEYAREEANYTFYYFRVGKSFEEWKQTNGKSYWKDLAGRLRVLEVSADTTQPEDNISKQTINPCQEYTNSSKWKCEYNESTGHMWITMVGWCNDCEGEGCMPEEPKLTELDDNWTEVDESIFEMYPIHNPPTIYVMQASSGGEYHTFKLPIYRRI
jgi:hypothetical protein